MRASKREEILDSIVGLIEDKGVTGITFDAVAERSGVTRGGLIYHFPSRAALVQAIHEHMVRRWEDDLAAALGKPAAQANAAQREAAYIRVSGKAATRGELLMMLESAGDAALVQLWADAVDQWTPPVPAPDDEAGISRFIARLAADGLWISDVLSFHPISPELKRKIADRLEAMIGEVE